uniref:Uncharacterized protein n=1 Tax=Cacopsylla melanoneura TaxID=428564 RepID=A0A8D9BTJ8_9HEMI
MEGPLCSRLGYGLVRKVAYFVPASGCGAAVGSWPFGRGLTYLLITIREIINPYTNMIQPIMMNDPTNQEKPRMSDPNRLATKLTTVTTSSTLYEYVGVTN